ncbi:MAG: NAD-dependent epimerase/dehydratase family protein [Rubrivivax sp.]|nr:NAD-dependent epimerase/dehydratase family protein [Rubrivivax sp.]
MNIFITGAGGYIGGSVAAALLANGHHVRGLARSEPSAAKLAARGIEPVLGTLDDAGLLAQEARNSDGVINTASADHAGAVESLLAGLEGSSKPLLHTSGSSVVGDDARGSRRSAQVFDGLSPLVVNPAKQSRRNIDLAVLGAAARGVRSAVICPSLIYGVGTGPNPHSVQIPFLAANARERGRVQIVGAGLNVWSNVHIDDVVDLYLLALAKAPAGAFYFAENGEASFGDIGAAVARRLALPNVESLPPELAAQRWGEPRAYFSLGSNSRVSSIRARRELGWAPHHASLIAWILGAMPVDASAASSS